MYMYICMYICMYVCMYVYMYVCVCVCITLKCKLTVVCPFYTLEEPDLGVLYYHVRLTCMPRIGGLPAMSRAWHVLSRAIT